MARNASASFSTSRHSRSSQFTRRSSPPPPSNLNDAEIARKVQQSAVRVRVLLQLDSVRDEKKTLRDVLAEFEHRLEAQRINGVTERHELRVDLLECGLNSWQDLVELQRVIMGLKRPAERGEEQQLTARAMLSSQVPDELTLSLWFDKDSIGTVWKFTSSLMLKLRSCGILSKGLLPPRRMMVNLAVTRMELKQLEYEAFQWEGKQSWSQIVVELISREKEEIQRAFLPYIAPNLSAQLHYTELASILDGMLTRETDNWKPIVIIMRGIPGSGKSTLRREVENICRNLGVKFTACSADFWFETPRGYRFDGAKLKAAHNSCRDQFSSALAGDCQTSDGRQQHVVFVDNTNTQRWEYKEYESIAKSSGSQVYIFEMKCVDHLMAYRMGRRNSHGVPQDKVVSMFMRWEEDRRARYFTPRFEYPSLTRNPLSDGIAGKILYLGLFLDDASQQKLLAQIPLVHSRKFADHVTLFYRPNKMYTRFAELGAPFCIRGVEVVQDESGQALRVDLDFLSIPVRNKIPHITLSTRNGVNAVYSNDLLESGKAQRKKCTPPLEITTRVGAAIVIQNRQMIITSSLFDVNTKCCHKSVLNPSQDNTGVSPEHVVASISRLFILYVAESDLVNGNEDTLTKLLRRAQLVNHIGSRCDTLRLLCIQKSQVSSPLLNSVMLSRMQNWFCIFSSHIFDDMVVLPQPPSCQSLEKAIDEYVITAGHESFKKVTLMTSVKESEEWPLSKMKSLFCEASFSLVHVRDQADHFQSLITCQTILSALDLLGTNIQEDVQSTISAGMKAINEACAHVFGKIDDKELLRIDTALPALNSSVIEVAVLLPSGVASSETEAYKIKMMRALNDIPSIHHVVGSNLPNQVYFSLCSALSNAPHFCVMMEWHGRTAQMLFVERQLVTSRAACDIEAYSVLCGMLRPVLWTQCTMDLRSVCRRSSLINLISERLVVYYLDSFSEGRDGRPTADDATSGRIVITFYDMISYLSKLESDQWAAVFDTSLEKLQGNDEAQLMWRNAMTSMMRNCVAILASHRCLSGETISSSQFDFKSHLSALVALMKTDAAEATHGSLERAYIKVLTPSWSPLHSLAYCDKLRNAASMALSQADDANSPGFFSCASSLVSRRLDVTCSSRDHLRIVMEKVKEVEAALGADCDGGVHAEHVICRSDADEEVDFGDAEQQKNKQLC
ncbi:hypothetical protein CCR75_002625 [Bremia lactucae]|uniref:tRNA ligase phosphodiesterase domain-containing protein n=1 Tax=Bremia lactucae TaxID=4779 RepID=A0A976ILI8_BRELC|nr:hypothetical protein CCR75_002625 [Bremia lactucae]